MALQVAVQAARRRLNREQPAQLPSIPPLLALPAAVRRRVVGKRLDPAHVLDVFVSLTQSTSCLDFGFV